MNEESLLAKREEIIELLDIYEKALSEKQARTLSSYFRYDLSLGEIAEEEAISRSAVYDALSKGMAKLEKLEKDIGALAYRKNLKSKAESALKEEDRLSKLEELAKEISDGI